jgi:ankyrin repeat protein
VCVVLQYLGKKWLQKRLLNQGTEFSLEEADKGTVADVNQAIEEGTNLNAYLPTCESTQNQLQNQLPSKRSLDQYTLLHYASGNGVVEAVRLLLRQDTVVANMPSSREGQTSMYFAAQNGHVEVLRLLIGSGADVNIEDVRGFGPLYMAALRGHADCVQLLIDSGAYAADLNQEIMLIAEGKGHYDVVKLLCNEGGANVDQWMGLDIHELVQQKSKASILADGSAHGSILSSANVRASAADRESTMWADGLTDGPVDGHDRRSQQHQVGSRQAPSAQQSRANKGAVRRGQISTGSTRTGSAGSVVEVVEDGEEILSASLLYSEGRTSSSPDLRGD